MDNTTHQVTISLYKCGTSTIYLIHLRVSKESWNFYCMLYTCREACIRTSIFRPYLRRMVLIYYSNVIIWTYDNNLKVNNTTEADEYFWYNKMQSQPDNSMLHWLNHLINSIFRKTMWTLTSIQTLGQSMQRLVSASHDILQCFLLDQSIQRLVSC